MLSRGLSEKEIATRLYISEKTVNNHLYNLRKKCKVHKNIELVAYYVALLKGKVFDLDKLRKFGIRFFL